jgi:hypothetical protein
MMVFEIDSNDSVDGQECPSNLHSLDRRWKMSGRNILSTTLALLLLCSTARIGSADVETWKAPVTNSDGPVVIQVVMVEDQDENPVAAGRAAAEALKKKMGNTALKAVIVSECFEDRECKEPLLQGICQVIDKDMVFGGATYGSFTQSGCTDFDSVCLLGFGGEGIGVSAALVQDMGTAKLAFDEHEAEIKQRLHAAGTALSKKLPTTTMDKLLVLIPDAHSPKNQYLVEGAQHVFGSQFPMTGGSANKNAGQTFVYYRGRMYQDSAVAFMLSGDFQIAMAGRLAKEKDAVIQTAEDGAREAMKKMKKAPLAVLAYNCAGRRSKLVEMEEELEAIQKAIGAEVPLFGCYNAGEIGPLDASEQKPNALCGGSGWHVIFTVIGR